MSVAKLLLNACHGEKRFREKVIASIDDVVVAESKVSNSPFSGRLLCGMVLHAGWEVK